jgi:hypothetical protein
MGHQKTTQTHERTCQGCGDSDSGVQIVELRYTITKPGGAMGERRMKVAIHLTAGCLEALNES